MKSNVRKPLNEEQAAALKEFQGIYGDKWQQELYRFNLGTPSQPAVHLLGLLRQIRNSVTGNPGNLPDLREESS